MYSVLIKIFVLAFACTSSILMAQETERFPPTEASDATSAAENNPISYNRIDQTRQDFSTWLNQKSHIMDDWFGTPDPSQPASANLRVILDQQWNKHDQFEFRPRLRGKLRLPTLENKFSLVFGDDSLDNQLANQTAISNENPQLATDTTYSEQRSRDDNSSIALRWSEWSKKLNIDSDVDLGIRSGDDIYLRLKVAKDWQWTEKNAFLAEQIYRYGLDSKNYFRTNLELRHAQNDSRFLSNQFSLIYADEQQEDWQWHNYSFQQQQFFPENRFNYGLYSAGYKQDQAWQFNSWGPFISWRQPLFRQWFFVQTDLNYFNDKRLDRTHFLASLVRLEALF